MKHLFLLILIILTTTFCFARGTKKDVAPKTLNQTPKLISDTGHLLKKFSSNTDCLTKKITF